MLGRSRAAEGEEPDSGERAEPMLSQRLARLIDRSPAVRDVAVEVGVVDLAWLEQPSRRKPAVAPPLEVLRRFLERTVERTRRLSAAWD